MILSTKNLFIRYGALATFLKNDKINRHPSSIVWRLTFFYTLSASILLIGITVFLYEALVTNLREEDKQFLVEKVQSIEMLLQKNESHQTFLEKEIQLGVASGQITPYYTYYSRILKADHTALIETPGMIGIVPVTVFPMPSAETKKENLIKSCIKWESANNHPFLLLTTQTTDNAGQLRIIQVALDITHENAVLADYKRKLTVILPLGILLSAMFGALITRQGLKPLSDITLAAQSITASDLHARISRDQWPRELRTLAVAFDQMLERLEDSFTRLNQFSENLAHELRTPINNLMGEAEVTLARTRSEFEYRDAMESILEECGKLSSMIDSLLFLARADNIQVPLQRKRLDIRQELEAICASYEAVIEEQSLTIKCEGHSYLDVDPILFQRAITNVLSNAIRYTPSGGTIKLTVTPSQSEHNVFIRISDSGCGIARKHLSKIFDRFYRIDRVRSTVSHNTGLGLAIVRSIMTLHGGTVSIESETGKGTTVTLNFPLSIN